MSPLYFLFEYSVLFDIPDKFADHSWKLIVSSGANIIYVHECEQCGFYIVARKSKGIVARKSKGKAVVTFKYKNSGWVPYETCEQSLMRQALE